MCTPRLSCIAQIRLLTRVVSALPILRQLGAQSGGGTLRSGDFSMLKVWAGLEARKFLQASVESVEMCVKYDQLSPNI